MERKSIVTLVRRDQFGSVVLELSEDFIDQRFRSVEWYQVRRDSITSEVLDRRTISGRRSFKMVEIGAFAKPGLHESSCNSKTFELESYIYIYIHICRYSQMVSYHCSES